MRLPGYVAEGGVPSSAPGRVIAEPSAVGAGLQEAGGALATAGIHATALIAQADAAKQRYQQALDATTLVTDAADQLDQHEETLRTGRRDPDTGELIEPPATSKNYMPAWLAGADEISKQITASAPDPQTAMVAQKLWAAKLAERRGLARKTSDKMFMDEYTAGVDQQLQSIADRAARDPNGQDWENLAAGVLNSARGALSNEAIQKRATAFGQHVDVARARRLGDVDPELAIQRLQDGYYRMPPDRAEQEATRIDTRYQAKLQRLQTEERRQETELQQSMEHYRTATVGALSRDASNGQLTTSQLDEWAGVMNMGRGDYEAIRTIIEKPPKEAPSEPGTLDSLEAGIYRLNPTKTQTDVLRARSAGLINENDKRRLLEALTSQQRQQQDHGETLAHQQYQAAIATGKAELGIPDFIDEKFDKTTLKAWAGFTRTMHDRAYPGVGRENPDAVANEILPRYRAMLGNSINLNEQQLNAVLLYKTPADLEAAKAAGKLPGGLYNQQREYLQMWDALQTKRQQIQTPPPAATRAKGSWWPLPFFGGKGPTSAEGEPPGEPGVYTPPGGRK